jgi:hypothetical protein
MFSNLLSPDNRGLLIAVLGGLVVAIALIIAVIYRVAFGHRLRVPGGGRARQPRLGLVDAFSLDGQRQLVLVRRDNVEHLIMIGGPNDVLVESQIIRAAVSPAARERDAAAVKALPIAPVHALGGAPAAAIEAPPQPAEPAPPPPQPPRIAPRFEAPTVKPAERVAPAPLRPAIRAVAPANEDAGPGIAPAKPVAPAPAPAKPVAPAPTPAKPVAPAPARPAVQARSPLPPPIVAAPAARTRATPVLPPSPEAPAAPPQPVARPPSPETPAPPAKPPVDEAFGDLESLEAEMARLLGRDA